MHGFRHQAQGRGHGVGARGGGAGNVKRMVSARGRSVQFWIGGGGGYLTFRVP